MSYFAVCISWFFGLVGGTDWREGVRGEVRGEGRGERRREHTIAISPSKISRCCSKYDFSGGVDERGNRLVEEDIFGWVRVRIGLGWKKMRGRGSSGLGWEGDMYDGSFARGLGIFGGVGVRISGWGAHSEVATREKLMMALIKNTLSNY